MTPADRLDSMLRAELRRADDLVVADRYDAVVARSAQRTRRRGAGIAAVSLIVLGIAAGVGLTWRTAATDPAPVEPPHAETLQGTWSRTIDGEPWTISFERGAVLRIIPGGDPPDGTDGASYDVTAMSLRIDAFANGECTELTPGSYRWSLDGSTRLRLQADEEPCQLRLDVFDGIWTAKP